MKITLHEAITIVLKQASQPMTSTDIAKVANKRQLYHRKDGNPIPASQIRARANKYPKLFELDGRVIKIRN